MSRRGKKKLGEEQSPVDVALGDVKAVLSTVVPPGWEEANDLCIADLDAEQIRRFPAHAFKLACRKERLLEFNQGLQSGDAEKRAHIKRLRESIADINKKRVRVRENTWTVVKGMDADVEVGFDPTDLRDRRLWQHLQAKREEVLAASESESESEADVALSAGQEGLDGNLTDESNSTAPIEAEEDCLQFSEVEDEVQLT